MGRPSGPKIQRKMLWIGSQRLTSRRIEVNREWTPQTADSRFPGFLTTRSPDSRTSSDLGQSGILQSKMIYSLISWHPDFLISWHPDFLILRCPDFSISLGHELHWTSAAWEFFGLRCHALRFCDLPFFWFLRARSPSALGNLGAIWIVLSCSPILRCLNFRLLLVQFCDDQFSHSSQSRTMSNLGHSGILEKACSPILQPPDLSISSGPISISPRQLRSYLDCAIMFSDFAMSNFPTSFNPILWWPISQVLSAPNSGVLRIVILCIVLLKLNRKSYSYLQKKGYLLMLRI